MAIGCGFGLLGGLSGFGLALFSAPPLSTVTAVIGLVVMCAGLALGLTRRGLTVELHSRKVTHWWGVVVPLSRTEAQ